MKKLPAILAILILVIALGTACGGGAPPSTAPPPTPNVQQIQPTPTLPPGTERLDRASIPTPRPASPGQQPASASQPEPALPAQEVASVDTPVDLVALSVPRAPILEATHLLFQPEGNPITLDQVPQDTRLHILGKDDKTEEWYRVLWGDRFGWVHSNNVDYHRIDRISALRAPPPCAQPEATVTSLQTEWPSNKDGQQEFVTVIDLYRESAAGAQIVKTLQIKKNGQPIPGKNRDIKSSGRFLMRGSAISLRLNEGERLGYGFLSGDQGDIKLSASIFYVPNGCEWEIDEDN